MDQLIIKVILFSITFSPSVFANNLERLCKSHVDFKQKAVESRLPVADILKEASLHDLIFIGESHFEEEFTNAYRNYLSQVVSNDSDFNCLFIESDAVFWGQKLEACNQDSESLDMSLVESNYESVCSGVSHAWINIQNEAFKHGLKVYAVDAPDDMCWSGGYANINNCRDSYMLENIQKRIDEGSCDKAISINGAPHITSIFDGHKPLAQRKFTRQGVELKVFRINFVLSSIIESEQFYDPRWVWIDWKEAFNYLDEPPREVCRAVDLFKDVPGEFGFFHENMQVNSHPYVLIDEQPKGNWFDFEASIIIGW